jgi:hypothetical protein
MPSLERTQVRLVHVAPGRARMRLVSRLAPDGIGALADRLAATAGLRRVVVRPNTGSVIVESELGAEALAALINGLDFLKIVPPEKPLPVGQAVRFGEFMLDQRIRSGTEGALDLRSTLGLLFIGAAIVQLMRGRIAGPATTLALAAFYLMQESKP